MRPLEGGAFGKEAEAADAASSTIAQLLVDTGLSPSLAAARRSIGEGGVYVNNVRVDDEASVLDGSLLAGRMAVLRRGKKTLAGVFAE